MSRTYCGKSCVECEFKEELSCPGCQAGPGKRYGGECQLAKCCISKGHETCETCQILPHCGTNRGSARFPEERIWERQYKQAQEEALAQRSPVFGRWLWILFWLVVPSTIASLLLNETVAGLLPDLRFFGTVLQGLTVLAHGLILLRLSKLEETYKTAALCALAGGAVTVLVNVIFGGQEEVWMLLLTIPAAVASVVGKYKEFTAHSNAAADVGYDLSENWLTIRKWYVIIYASLLGSLLVLVIIPILGLLVILAAAIGVIVLAIAEMVILYRTAKAFRNHAAYVRWNKEEA